MFFSGLFVVFSARVFCSFVCFFGIFFAGLSFADLSGPGLTL